jgi:hypothetical protein
MKDNKNLINQAPMPTPIMFWSNPPIHGEEEQTLAYPQLLYLIPCPIKLRNSRPPLDSTYASITET